MALVGLESDEGLTTFCLLFILLSARYVDAFRTFATRDNLKAIDDYTIWCEWIGSHNPFWDS